MARATEGRLVLRNAVSIGAFLMAPLQMLLMVRALGTDGYGRWWWTWAIIEGAAIVGMLGADLYVRREVPRMASDHDDELVEVVGTSLTVAAVSGVLLLVAQVALAPWIASERGDPPLAAFLTILAFQPVLWNLNTVLGAGLQSRNYLGLLAVVRGIVTPGLQCAGLFVAWHWQLGVPTALVLMTAGSGVALVLVAALYARHLPLGRTLVAALRPRKVRDALANGVRLFVPLVLFTIGGKLDLYVLGAYALPATVAIYGACLQVGSGITNTRVLFDPVIQTQVGALARRDHEALGASLRKLARLCAFGLAPAFVITVAIGAPLLGWLIGGRTTAADWPLAVLAVGNLLACVAVGTWLMSMLLSGRLLGAVALAALTVKLALLLVLVPRYGALGAAIATSTGAIVAYHGQAIGGARVLGVRAFEPRIAPVLATALVVAAAGRALFDALELRIGEVPATCATGAASMVALALALFVQLTGDDRAELRKLIRGAA